MKGVLIAIGPNDGRGVAARVVDGRLDDLIVEPRAGLDLAPGAIWRGRAGRPMKGQGGMFVDLGAGGQGFLRASKGISPGQSLLVQISGYAEVGKAPPVTTRLSFKSRFCVVTPDAPGLNVARSIKDEDTRQRLGDLAVQVMGGGGEHGAILRTACADANPDDVAGDLTQVSELAKAILVDVDGAPELLLDGAGAEALAWRDWPWGQDAQILQGDGALDDAGVTDQIDGIGRDVGLPGGAFMAIEPTRALVAVDVNTGAASHPGAGLAANVEAARDLARQLRLRGLGGQVVIDFAPMPHRDRQRVEQVLKKELRADPVDTAIVGWTPLGHLELQRKRERHAWQEDDR